MSASFASASSQVLLNSTPLITASPFTVGMWVNALSASQFGFWSIGDGTSGSHFFYLRQTTTTYQFRAAAGAGANNAAAGTVAANSWVFLVARAISATNRRIAVLHGDGSTAHGNDTFSVTPVAVDTETLGSNDIQADVLNGKIAEFWIANADIQRDGTQLKDQLFRQLAYGGPFSVPHIAKDIIKYRSFRVFPDTRGDRSGEVYYGSAGRETWSNVNGVTTGFHPPLPYWYRKPDDSSRMLMA